MVLFGSTAVSHILCLIFRFACESSHISSSAHVLHPDVAVAAIIDGATDVVVGGSTPRVEVGLGYDSVGGCGKTIQLIRELVEMPLRFPELWTTAGVPTPKGVLLHGPPGCGKTMLAKAVAN